MSVRVWSVERRVRVRPSDHPTGVWRMNIGFSRLNRPTMMERLPISFLFLNFCETASLEWLLWHLIRNGDKVSERVLWWLGIAFLACVFRLLVHPSKRASNWLVDCNFLKQLVERATAGCCTQNAPWRLKTTLNQHLFLQSGCKISPATFCTGLWWSSLRHSSTAC